jgi:hypothetical protein
MGVFEMYVRYWESVMPDGKISTMPDESKHVVEECESIRHMDGKVRIFYCMKEHCEIWFRDISFKHFDYAVNNIKETGHEKEIREPLIVRAINNGPDRWAKGKEFVKTHRA